MRSEFDNLNIGTEEKNVTIYIEDREGKSRGQYLHTGLNDAGRIIRITNNLSEFQISVKNMIAHELFHYAQFNTISGQKIKTKSNEVRHWIVESTAVWFEDYLYDSDNEYRAYSYAFHTPFQKLLAYGLANQIGQGKYSTAIFWKLISEKCDFEDSLKNIFYADFSSSHAPTSLPLNFASSPRASVVMQLATRWRCV